MFVLPLLLLLSVCTVTTFGFSLDFDTVMTIVNSKQEAAKAIHQARSDKELLLVYFTFNLEKDGYAALYLGWLKHIFSSDLFDLRLLIVETGKHQFVSITDYCLDILPKESILVSFDHGLYVRRLKELGRMKDFDRLTLSSNITKGYAGTYRSISNFGMFHLNHEQPWNFEANFFHHDYSSQEELLHIYSQHGLVMRNYFYEPFNNNPNVLQLPVGPSFYGYWIGNKKFDSLRWDIPTSERQVSCRFIGRRIYVDKTRYTIPERDALFDIVGFDMLGYQEYTRHYGMYARHNYFVTREGVEVFPCQVYNYTINEPFNYELFMQILVETRFVPCPPGNNPETFRHYEVLEAGAIPLILVTPPNSGYLHSPFWADYPGPLFSNWADAGRFVQTISTEDADILQLQLRDWYLLFKQRIKNSVADAVLSHYPAVRKIPPFVHDENGLASDPATADDDTGRTASDGDDSDSDSDSGYGSNTTTAATATNSMLSAIIKRQKETTEALEQQNLHLKLLISELRDTQRLLMDDVMTLTNGINALLKGHSVYGERLSNIEYVMGIQYGVNGEGIMSSDFPTSPPPVQITTKINQRPRQQQQQGDEDVNPYDDTLEE